MCLPLTDPVNETIEANLTYIPGYLTAQYTYITRDTSIPYYCVLVLSKILGHYQHGQQHFFGLYSTLHPVQSYDVNLTTALEYMLLLKAPNKYMGSHSKHLVEICFTINENNEIMYRNGLPPVESCPN